jgi:hypothetical protein
MLLEVPVQVPDPSPEEEALNFTAQAVDDKNAKFAALGAAKKRVAIARDVLKWIGTGKLVPTAGTYLSSRVYNPEQGYYADERRDETRVDGGKCSACALGALFACKVEQVGGIHDFWQVRTHAKLHDGLSDYFSAEQLWAIESAFEQSFFFPDTYSSPWRTGYVGDEKQEYAYKCVQFCENLPDRYNDAVRMRAIMKNIIRNKGTFVPEQLP